MTVALNRIGYSLLCGPLIKFDRSNVEVYDNDIELLIIHGVLDTFDRDRLVTKILISFVFMRSEFYNNNNTFT